MESTFNFQFDVMFQASSLQGLDISIDHGRGNKNKARGYVRLSIVNGGEIICRTTIDRKRKRNFTSYKSIATGL